MNYPPRIHLANLPTPIEKLTGVSQQWGDVEIYVKRDDKTGMLMSGNKIRKLEFVIAEARQKGANVLITCGGIQSNHARATAVAARKLGMDSWLVLRGQVGGSIDGNLALDLLVGAKIKYITPEQYRNEVMDIMQDLVRDLEQQGYTPYIIPEGASDELGAIGYFAATEEIASQLKQMQLEIDYLVCAVGSGGTYAGLLLGQKYFKQAYQVIGFNVCDDASFFVKKITAISQKAIQRFNLNVSLTPSDVTIIDGYVGEGYSLNRPAEIEFIKHVAASDGLILDPVYTAKAMFGLREQIHSGKRFKKHSRFLFLHTGGLFGLFPKLDLFF
ncbi:MAG: D-cysteine desulfhydrase family protein [Candidatus Zhuqueibacterota bacterium]